MDEGSVTALTLLDLSAAFDTLEHNSITNLLSTWYGIDGIALENVFSDLNPRWSDWPRRQTQTVLEI